MKKSIKSEAVPLALPTVVENETAPVEDTAADPPAAGKNPVDLAMKLVMTDFELAYTRDKKAYAVDRTTANPTTYRADSSGFASEIRRRVHSVFPGLVLKSDQLGDITSQLAALFLFASYLAQVRKTLPATKIKKLGQAIIGLPTLLEETLPGLQKKIKTVANLFYDSRNFLFVGRGLNFPIALEGALKLKEISYIHAEGYAAGELKHGPIALIDKDMPILGLVPKDKVYEKSISNIEEIKARKGKLILIGSKGDRQLKKITDHVLYMPAAPTMLPELNPILFTIPAQLLAYEIATLRGCDVDQPRNLAKSVTVE